MIFSDHPFYKCAFLYKEDIGSTIHLWRIIQHFGDLPINAIDHLDKVEAGLEILPEATKETRRREIESVITAVINYGSGHRRVPNTRPATTRWFSPEEVERILTAADDEDVVGRWDPMRHTRKKIALMVGAGPNPGEMIAIDVEDVRRESKQIWIGEDKTPFRPRWTRPADRAWDLMGDFPHEGRAFRTPQGKPHVARVRGGGQMASAFKRIAEAAGVELKRGEGPRLLRHTWATFHYAQNKDLQLLMRLGGWGKSDTAFYYAKFAPDDLADRVLAHGWDFRA